MFDNRVAYISSSVADDILEIACKYDIDLLVSYAYKKDCEKLLELRKLGQHKGCFLIDSGQFTNYHAGKGGTDLDEYADYVNQNDEWITAVIGVDEILPPDATKEIITTASETSWENFVYLVKKMKSPKKLLPVAHQFDPNEIVKRYAEYQYEDGSYLDYMCISASKEIPQAQRMKYFDDMYNNVLRNTKNPKVKTHILGTLSAPTFYRYPCYSADASTAIKNAIYGLILVPPEHVENRTGGTQIRERELTEGSIMEPVLKELGMEWIDLIGRSTEASNARQLVNTYVAGVLYRDIPYPQTARIKKGLF